MSPLTLIAASPAEVGCPTIPSRAPQDSKSQSQTPKAAAAADAPMSPRVYTNLSFEPIVSLLSYRSGLSGSASIISVDRGTTGPVSDLGAFNNRRRDQQDEKRKAMERRWEFMLKEREFLSDLVEFYRHPNTGRLLQSSPLSALIVKAYEKAGLKEPPLPDMSTFLDIQELCRLFKHVREWSRGEDEPTMGQRGMGLGGGERPKWWTRLQRPEQRGVGTVAGSFRQRVSVGPRASLNASLSTSAAAAAAGLADPKDRDKTKDDKDGDQLPRGSVRQGSLRGAGPSLDLSAADDDWAAGPAQHASDEDKMQAHLVQWHYGRPPAAQRTFTAREGGLQLSTLGQMRSIQGQLERIQWPLRTRGWDFFLSYYRRGSLRALCLPPRRHHLPAPPQDTQLTGTSVWCVTPPQDERRSASGGAEA